MWPNAKICVMGPDQLSSVMQTVSGKNKPAVEGEDRWKELRSKIEAQSEATYSTARIWVSPISLSAILIVCLHPMRLAN